MLRSVISIIGISLILSACAGGLGGLVSSSFPDHYLVYKVSYADAEKQENNAQDYERQQDEAHLEKSAKELIEHQFFSQGFRNNYDWRRPWFSRARVATFKRKYSGHYISVDVEISRDSIILISPSYSVATKNIFDTLESGLTSTFDAASVEKCFGTKDINGFSCFNMPIIGKWTKVSLK